MAVDVSQIKQEKTVVLSDGRQGIVKGAYMSADNGLVILVKTGDSPVVCQNVPLSDIVEVKP